MTAANSRGFFSNERSYCTCTNKYTEISQNLQPNTGFWWEKTHPHIQNLLDGDVGEIDLHYHSKALLLPKITSTRDFRESPLLINCSALSKSKKGSIQPQSEMVTDDTVWLYNREFIPNQQSSVSLCLCGKLAHDDKASDASDGCDVNLLPWGHSPGKLFDSHGNHYSFLSSYVRLTIHSPAYDCLLQITFHALA